MCHLCVDFVRLGAVEFLAGVSWQETRFDLNLKILETQNIKPKYIRINNNGTLSLTDTTETTLLCTCGIQHNNLIEEKKFYISSIKTTMLSFIKNIKILIDEIPLEQKEMIGQINCTNEYKKLQNFEKNSI